MIKKILFLILLIIPVSGYSQNKKIFVIDPRVFGDEKITLSDIADDISYIPLDNTIPFGRVVRILVNKQDIYIKDLGAGILKFDRSGKFICKIGTKGRGPGEYLSASSFTIDEQSGNVYILEAPSNIKVYSKTSRFIRDIKLDRDLFYGGGELKMFNSKIFLANYLFTVFAKNTWIVLDTLGNIFTLKNNSMPPFELRKDIPTTTDGGSVFEFDNNLYYYNSYNDTVFSVSKDYKSNTAYLFAQGKFRIPAASVEGESFRKLFRPGQGLFLTRQYIILSYQYLEKYATAVIDKNTLKVFNVPSLINDIDGGLPFAPRYYYFDSKSTSEYFAQTIDPLTLKKHIESDQFKNGTFRDPIKKKELQAIASKIDESDNPVLMMVRLKK